MTKLFDITSKTISGEWGSNDDDKTGIPVIRTTNFTNEGNIDYSNVVTRKIKKNNIEKKFLKYGDIIIEKSGGSDNQPVGRVVYFDNKDGKYLFNNFTGLLRVKDTSKWNSRYVFWSLFASYKQGKTKMYQNKTTGLHNLRTDAYVKDLNIKDLSFKSQVNISNILDKARKEIELRKEELAKLDTLIKARFVEMFGDPIVNPYNFKQEKLECLSCLITKGASPTWQGFNYVEDDDQTLFITSENVKNGYLDLKKSKYVENKFNDKHRRSILQKGDFLINIVGASIGRAAQYSENKLANINQAVALVRLKSNVISSVYLSIYLNSNKALDMYQKMQSNVARANLSLQNIKDLEIILPPIELQNEFASFVQQVDKSKVVNASIMKYIISIRFYLYFKENKEGAR